MSNQTTFVDFINDLPGPYRRWHRKAIYWSSIGAQALAPKVFDSWIVLGHVASGTNWLCCLLSDYLQIPIYEDWKRITPSLSPHIFHMHRFLPSKKAAARTIYLYRDGRDVIVSTYFKFATSPHDLRPKHKFEDWLGEAIDPARIRDQLPEFIDFYFGNKQFASIGWPEHVRKSFERDYLRISYEALRLEPPQAMASLVATMGLESNSNRIAQAVAKNDFDYKRKQDTTGFVHAGVVGDWRQHFTRLAAERFHHWCGDELILLGYERDPSWIDGIGD